MWGCCCFSLLLFCIWNTFESFYVFVQYVIYDGAMSVSDFFKVNPRYDLVKERKKEKHDHNDQNIPLCVM